MWLYGLEIELPFRPRCGEYYAMQILAQCPKCQQDNDAWSGQNVECAHCGNVFSVDANGAASAPIATRPAPKQAGVTFGQVFKLVAYVILSLIIIGALLRFLGF